MDIGIYLLIIRILLSIDKVDSKIRLIGWRTRVYVVCTELNYDGNYHGEIENDQNI